jgi:hypothetical protein
MDLPNTLHSFSLYASMTLTHGYGIAEFGSISFPFVVKNMFLTLFFVDTWPI